jgi:hypothetical protein
MSSKQAVIGWIAKEDGGRTKPPSGAGSPPYSTVIRFVDGGATWPPDESWSLVVSKRKELGTEYHWLADVHFLVQDAPHEYLCEGRTFELHEGAKCVARGKILVQQDVDSAIAAVIDTHV